MSKQDARKKILDAAEEIARDAGPGHLSLDAVAHRAGVSKGGLLYHFPSKAKLLEAVVERFITNFADALALREKELDSSPNRLLEAYLDLFSEDAQCDKPPASGILAALAEDPSFMAPVRRFERKMFERIKQESADPALAMLVFLALGGLRSMRLLEMDILGDKEFDEAMLHLRALVTTPA